MIEFAPMPQYKFSFNEAWLYCLTLNYNRHKDWRIPTEQEYMDYYEIISDSFDERDIDEKYRYFVVPVRDVND